MSFRNPDLKESFHKMLKAKQNLRPQEDIIGELIEILKCLHEDDFIKYVMGVLCSVEHRESWIFNNLASPMMQMIYLIDVYYSIQKREPQFSIDKKRWNRITELLDEIELNYFVSMGFGNNGDFFHDERDDKVAVSLMTYFCYYSNARLSYDEQTLWRIENYCAPYDKYIRAEFGFSIRDAIEYIEYLSTLYNGKLTDSVRKAAEKYSYYRANPDKWKDMATNWLNQGIHPEDWLKQPELKDLRELLETNPGECFICEPAALYSDRFNPEINNRLIDFFKYPARNNQNHMEYYGSERTYTGYPLVFTEKKVAIPYIKFSVEALYTRIDKYLSQHPDIKIKYKQSKDSKLEEKVLDLFRSLFKNDAHYYANYSIDGKCEQDLLIEYKGIYFVIEVKDCNFREPMRDSLKSFVKIKKDFSNSIQKGYEQCKRVEDALSEEKPIRILDGKTFKRELYVINPSRIKEVYSIIVTEYKYGPIQTDLSKLLSINEDRPYPWSVCIDDLEAFILLLRKKFHNGAKSHFIKYIESREAFHGHTVCCDELELCGYYVCQPIKFKELSTNEYTVCTFGGMSDIFDAYYYTGLGFKNEINAEIKKTHRLPEYATRFDMNLTGLGNLI